MELRGSWVFVLFYAYFLQELCVCERIPIPIGIITESRNNISIAVLENALFAFKSSTRSTFGQPYDIQLKQEVVSDGDAAQLNKAICKFLQNGIYAIIAPANTGFYKIIAPYSNEYEIPLLGPVIPEIYPDLVSNYGVSLQISTTRAILDLIRHYRWQHIVYIYDNEDGAQKLQTIFQLGYRVLDTKLLGIKRISVAEDANMFLRKLYQLKIYNSLHVILDTRPSLAQNIIIRYVHDVHMGKSNLHFLIAQPIMEDFWIKREAEFGTVNVTGFIDMDFNKTEGFRRLWNSLPNAQMYGVNTEDFNRWTYYYHDIGLVLAEGLRKLLLGARSRPIPKNALSDRTRDCLQSSSPLQLGRMLALYIRQSSVMQGVSGKIVFDDNGQRTGIELNIVETTRDGYEKAFTWSHLYGLRAKKPRSQTIPTSSPNVDKKRRYAIATVLSPPFMMLRNSNDSNPLNNDNFHGYCKDLMDLLAKRIGFDYTLNLVKEYGRYDESKGKWTGIIGELIRGNADIGLADLHINGRRYRVVDFTDPFASGSLSLMMKNPQDVLKSTSTILFLLSAFTGDLWICILVVAVIVATLFHLMAKFTGTPDNIEAASGIWGKKFTLIGSTWFTAGSSLMHDTGVYPRSISSRVLGSAWWCFTLFLLAVYISCLTAHTFISKTDTDQSPQLTRLTSLSLETILTESTKNGWPQIGTFRNGYIHRFLKASTVPVFARYAQYVDDHPEVTVKSFEAGIQRVRESGGNYGFLMESPGSEYYSREFCDTVSIADSETYAAYGMAIRQGFPLKFELNEALSKILQTGELSHLHRKWLAGNNYCGRKAVTEQIHKTGTLLSLSSIFYMLLLGLAITAIIGTCQYFYRAHKKEERRQKLSFEEVSMGQTLPLPPPELLAEAPLLEQADFEKRTHL